MTDLMDCSTGVVHRWPFLSKCPKCGGEAMICDFGEEHWVACKVCHYDTVSYDRIEDAIRDWNRRESE